MEKEMEDYIIYNLVEIEQQWNTEDDELVTIPFYQVKEIIAQRIKGTLHNEEWEEFDYELSDIGKEGTWFNGVFLEDYYDLEEEFNMSQIDAYENFNWVFTTKDEAEKMFNEQIEELKRMDDKKDSE